ncbi:hypothetical protein [Corynebacterium liangguodongii]|uniref:hypothetical protein n=1 Tax=Corynebacterium liangguodongii TaxID=2079535 RepID=UPI001304B949|nr:hypothetical protein [Corynebacterium liangguodongii]
MSIGGIVATVLSIIPAIIGTGLSSFGLYTLAVRTGLMDAVPAIDQFAHSII